MFRKFLPLLALLPILACGPKPPNIPEFMTNPPKQAGKLFGTGEGKKQTLQLAKETADSRACKEIARNLSQRVESIMKDFLEQSGAGKDAEALEFTQSVTKSITDVELTGCTSDKREVREEDGGYHVYSLAVLDADQAVAVAKGMIAAQKSRAGAKVAFDELDREVEKLRNLP